MQYHGFRTEGVADRPYVLARDRRNALEVCAGRVVGNRDTGPLRAVPVQDKPSRSWAFRCADRPYIVSGYYRYGVEAVAYPRVGAGDLVPLYAVPV